MTQKVIADVKGFVPTKKFMEAIDDNFDELYGTTDVTNAADIATNVLAIDAVEADIVTVKAGTSFALTEYADNTAAVTGGLAIGDLYTTTGTVKVVTA